MSNCVYEVPCSIPPSPYPAVFQFYLEIDALVSARGAVSCLVKQNVFVAFAQIDCNVTPRMVSGGDGRGFEGRYRWEQRVDVLLDRGGSPRGGALNLHAVCESANEPCYGFDAVSLVCGSSSVKGYDCLAF